MLAKFSVFVLVLIFPLVVFSQIQTIRVPLEVQKLSPSGVTHLVATLNVDQKETTGKILNNLLVSVIRSSRNPNTFSITIDRNNNQKLTDETAFDLAIEEKKFITLPTKSGVNPLSREFEFSAAHNEDNKTDSIWLRANYSAKGIFKYQGCKMPIVLMDLNSNGVFAYEENGSSFGVDRNNDGKIWGKGEWSFPTEIIDFCGRNFLITDIAKDGNSLSFRRTNLQNAKIFGQSPEFSLQSVKAKQLSSTDLKGKAYLLDFWATWCGICLEKMPEIKQLEGTLPIIYFNTDTISRKQQALALINKLGISENSVLRVFPNADNLYKSYQRLEFGLPFYVLIDGEGTIRYGGSGGDNLKELKDKIAEVKK